VTRRQFLASGAAGSAVIAGAATSEALAAITPPAQAAGVVTRRASIPAILGGPPLRSKPFPAWPRFDAEDEQAILPVLRGGVWSRDKVVAEAERRFAELMGSPHALMTCNGTNAILTSLMALGVAPGDEVITTPYTFVATIQPILLLGALPVFADVDPFTWQVDPALMASRVTSNTKALLPVHILGGVCDMDRIGALAVERSLRVVEDACEAHLAEWKGRRAGTFGDLGCFSFQTGKVLSCGEGGAILGRDADLMDLCHSIHNLGRPRGRMPRDRGGYPIVASKSRMAEYQASILLTRMPHLAEETKLRAANAAYLTQRLEQIPGIVPRADHAGVTQKAFYYYGFRARLDALGGPSRDRFLDALEAEGIPASKGLGVVEDRGMNEEGLIAQALASKAYRHVYPAEKLASYASDNACPLSDRLCQETVGFHQRVLLGTRADMDDIADAVQKLYENREKLAA
jgi:dTDP-4-amino-4,6-dideoxygalactose transaminase